MFSLETWLLIFEQGIAAIISVRPSRLQKNVIITFYHLYSKSFVI